MLNWAYGQTKWRPRPLPALRLLVVISFCFGNLILSGFGIIIHFFELVILFVLLCTILEDMHSRATLRNLLDCLTGYSVRKRKIAQRCLSRLPDEFEAFISVAPESLQNEHLLAQIFEFLPRVVSARDVIPCFQTDPTLKLMKYNAVNPLRCAGCTIAFSPLHPHVLITYSNMAVGEAQVRVYNVHSGNLLGQLPVPEPVNVNGERFVMRRAAVMVHDSIGTVMVVLSNSSPDTDGETSIRLVLLSVWDGGSKARLAFVSQNCVSHKIARLEFALDSPVGVACLNNRIYFADSHWSSSVHVFTAGLQRELGNTKWTDLADPGAFSLMFSFNSLKAAMAWTYL
jgi:hypothetical protein